jgi:hypothetical protein
MKTSSDTRCAFSHAIRQLVFCLACVLLTGCGNGLSQVTGTVTLDGQPLTAGENGARVTVQFFPASGVGPNGVGVVDESGYYKIGTGSQFGVPAGEYNVTCSVGFNLPPGSTAKPRGADPKFSNAKTSGLRFTVEPGKNQFDIPLTSAAKSPGRTGT